MSAELHDLRAKITAEAHCALEAIHRVTGRDKSEIVRDVMHAWGLDRLREATVMHQLAATEGIAGNHRASEGTAS